MSRTDIAARSTPPTVGSPGSSDTERWIGSSLANAMRRAQFFGLILVQLIVMVAALASSIAVPRPSVLLVSGAVTAAGALVLGLRRHPLVLIAPFYLAMGFYFVIARSPDDPLLGILVPLTAWTVVLPVMLCAGVWPVITAGALTAGFAGVILLAHPDWDRSVLGASVVTNVVLVVTSALFASSLRRVAGMLDREKEAATEEERRAARTRVAAETAAEYVRVLHDTIINTFGALARDRSRGIDPAEARERCRRDLGRIRDFQRTRAGGQHRLSLTDLDQVGLPVRWTGISGDDLRRFQALLPAPVLEAVHGCATEVILNASKHSGADHVAVDVQYADDELHVVISDAGRGFDLEQTIVRGIATSLYARARAHDIRVALESAVGTGTTVRLSCPLSGPGYDAAVMGTMRGTTVAPLRNFERRAAIAWTTQAAIIALTLETVSPQGGSLPANLVLGTIAVLGGLTWITSQDGRPVPSWLFGLVLAAVPLVNWWALDAVKYGDHAPYLFQGMSLTVLPVLLYVAGRGRWPFFIALILQLLSIAIQAATVADDLAAWNEILLLEAPPLTLVLVCYVFLHVFRTIGEELAASRRDAERAMREWTAHVAASEVLMQWNASSLQLPFQLLRDLAEGKISPSSPETRQRCADEEAYLRQVSTVAQRVTTMTRWLAVALAESRRRRVHLRLHVPERVQVSSPMATEAFGHLMVECIARCQTGSELDISLHQRDDEPHMLVVGRADPEFADRMRAYRAQSLSLHIEDFDSHTLVEATLRPAR
ncbi:sensor histidine kinase [Cellulosimicrobium cellulans]|uniref:sensor histidine kinase n=1 Tax=Cellulosimicrobium cellulans TaxID=1710 RepID=UPI0036538A08